MSLGQCLCGDFKYKIVGEILRVVACHCRMCQKISGGPFQIWAQCLPADVQFLQGSLRDYSSSANVIRQSCANCGSHLFFKYLDQDDQIYVTSTSLDDPNAVEPNLHIWFKRKISWLKLSDHIPTEE